MTQEQKAEYKKLQRQVGEAYERLFTHEGTRRKDRKPNLFNNRLQRMKDFLSALPEGDYSQNRFMKMTPIN